MSDEQKISPMQQPGVSLVRQRSGRLQRLVLKELREILRDRRTIITLVVMPLLIYPLLALVFQRFLLTSLSGNQEVSYVIGVDSAIGREILENQLQMGDAVIRERTKNFAAAKQSIDGKSPDAKKGLPQILPQLATPANPSVVLEDFPDSNLERFVADSTLHLAVVFRRQRINDDAKGLQAPLVWELIYRAGTPASEAALNYVESRLQACNEAGLDTQLRGKNISALLPAGMERRPLSYSGAPVFSLAALIPLILVLMTVTGAVYPAIDLTAGERERGTLETLIAAPVPRLGLLFAKYVAVLTVALLTAIVNLIGMTITAHSTGLGESLFGGGMSLGVVIKVLLLLALFAAFFSAILLAITSYARSFKEAQAYIIPLMLLCLVPGVLCLLPGLEFAGWMAVTPLVNIVMLARDLLEGSVQPTLAVAAVTSTLFYIAAAIGLAARIFGTDAILYGSPATWSDLVRRPSEPRRAASLGAAMFCLALMFPTYFILANSLGRSMELSARSQYIVRAIITAAIFGGIPLAVALISRVSWTSGFGLRRPNLLTIIGAILLGLSLWPTAHELTVLCTRYGLLTINPELFKRVAEVAKQFKAQPFWLIVIAFGITPAVFEELCFRGLLFGAIRERLSGVGTVIATAVLFGFFHEVLFPGKLIPTAALGIVLGWVRLRTGSVWPGILLHATHNSLVFAIIYYSDDLTSRGWGVQEESHLPLKWHGLASLGIGLGVSLLLASRRPPDRAIASPPPA